MHSARPAGDPMFVRYSVGRSIVTPSRLLRKTITPPRKQPQSAWLGGHLFQSRRFPQRLCRFAPNLSLQIPLFSPARIPRDRSSPARILHAPNRWVRLSETSDAPARKHEDTRISRAHRPPRCKPRSTPLVFVHRPSFCPIQKHTTRLRAYHTHTHTWFFVFHFPHNRLCRDNIPMFYGALVYQLRNRAEQSGA